MQYQASCSLPPHRKLPVILQTQVGHGTPRRLPPGVRPPQPQQPAHRQCYEARHVHASIVCELSVPWPHGRVHPCHVLSSAPSLFPSHRVHQRTRYAGCIPCEREQVTPTVQCMYLPGIYTHTCIPQCQTCSSFLPPRMPQHPRRPSSPVMQYTPHASTAGSRPPYRRAQLSSSCAHTCCLHHQTCSGHQHLHPGIP